MEDPRELRLNVPSRSVPEVPCRCQDCGAKAPTKRVEFYRLIGAVVVFHFKAVGGHFCKSCVHRYFWDYTLVTLCLGWWGCLSFLMTPFILLHNIVRYAFCLGMPPVPRVQTRNPAPAPASKAPEGQRHGVKKIEVIWDPPGNSAKETDLPRG